MICVCIGKPGVAECKERLNGVGLGEIRLDGAVLSEGEIRQIFSLPPALIATCRPGPLYPAAEERKRALLTAIAAGAAYVDIEMEAGFKFRVEIIQAAREHQCRVILSYHNYELTPPALQLGGIIEQCFVMGADIVKIACLANSEFDSARILSLYDNPGRYHKGRVIAFGMGDKGKITRLAALFLGAPFTYVSPAAGSETAPGQLTRESLEKVLESLRPPDPR